MQSSCTVGNKHHPFGPSSLERRGLCRLSYHEEKDLDEVKSEFADAGIESHHQIAELITKYTDSKGCLMEPDPDEIDSLPYELNTMFSRLFGIYNQEVVFPLKPMFDFQIYTEVALPLSEVTGNDEPYGTADCIILKPDEVIVIDWKTGRGETIDASNNLQTAAYCIAAAKHFNRPQATAYIVNPHFSQDNGFTFTEEMLQNALVQIIDIVKGGMLADEYPSEYVHTPGEVQCKYCKASLHGTCAAIRMALETIHSEVVKQDAMSAISVMTDDKLCEIKERCALVVKFTKAVDDEIKKRCDNGCACGEWFLKEISGGREITDLQSAYQVVSELITVDEFLGICSLSVPAFRDIIANKLKEKGVVKTKKGGQEMFDVDLANLINNKPPKKQLCKV